MSLEGFRVVVLDLIDGTSSHSAPNELGLKIRELHHCVERESEVLPEKGVL